MEAEDTVKRRLDLMNTVGHILGLLSLGMALATALWFLSYDSIFVVVTSFLGIIFACLSTISRYRFYAWISIALILIGLFLAMHISRSTGFMMPTLRSLGMYIGTLLVPGSIGAAILWLLHRRAMHASAK